MKQSRVFLLILIPFLLLATSGVTSSSLLGMHHFRQSHTAMMARNFAFHDANILHPTIDGISYGKDLYINEFPLYAYLVGRLWRIFGEHLVLARCLSIFFAIVALWYYRKLLVLFIKDNLVVNIAVFFMSVSPVFAYFAKAVQRQTLFMATLLAGTYYLAGYLSRGNKVHLALGTTALSIAVLLNPFSVYILAPLAFYAYKQKGLRGTLLDWRLYFALAILVLPSVAWYGYALRASRSLATGYMFALTDPVCNRNFLSLDHYKMWLVANNWGRALRTLLTYVVPSITSLALIVYAWRKARQEDGIAFWKVWMLAVILYFLMDFYPIAVVIHHYYYINIVPLTSLFFSLGLVYLYKAARRNMEQLHAIEDDGIHLRLDRFSAKAMQPLFIATICAVLYLAGSLVYTQRMERDPWHSYYYAIGDPLRRVLEPEDRVSVVAESGDPLFSYIFAPIMTHRLVVYNPERLSKLLADGDFDAIVVLCDTPSFPLDRVLSEIETVRYLGKPVLRSAQMYVFRKAGNGS